MLSLPVLIMLAAVQAASTPPATPAPKRAAPDCNAHKFDTVVSAEVAGETKTKRLKLCGEVGQSDGDWLKTLEDSIAKLEASESIARPLREAMVNSLKVEIVRLRTGTAPAPAKNGAPAASAGEFTLKPRAAAPKPGSGLADYHGLPPLPDPVVVKAREAAAFVPPPPITRPALDFRCFVSGAIAEAPCDELDRHGFVVVRARQGVGPGVALHFVLNGEDRSEIELSGMKKGQRRNLALPGDVCRGTAGGKLELRVMVKPAGGKHPAQRAETIGPAILRCA